MGNPWPYSVSVEDCIEAVQLAEQGLGRAEIAKRLGHSQYAFKRVLKAYREGRLRCRKGCLQLEDPATGIITSYGEEEDSAEPATEKLRRPAYILDRETSRYIFLLRCKDTLVVPRETIDSLVAGYSNDSGRKTINELAREYGWTRQTVIEVLHALGKTHDSLPYSDETIEETAEEDLIEDLIRQKEGRVAVEAEARRWDLVKKKARQWDAFTFGKLNPLADVLREVVPAYAVPKVEIKETGRTFAVLLGLADIHFGKLCWSEESGTTYDRSIARTELLRCLSETADQVAAFGRPDRIILPLGSDFLHIDTDHGTTTSGTPQDTDGSYARIFADGCNLAVTMVDTLRQLAPVQVLSVPGNHDRTATLGINHVLSAWFKDSADVEVDLTPKDRKYLVYGETLIGLDHGSDTKPNELPMIMANEAREDWGRTLHHCMFTGHLHHQMIEKHCFLYQVPSLSPPDRWHYRKGFTTSTPGTSAYIIDHSAGVIASLFCRSSAI